MTLGYKSAIKSITAHVDKEDREVVMLPNTQNGNTVGKYIRKEVFNIP